MTTENGKELGGHHCPDWDGLWVTPSSPEHEACTCYIGSAMTTNKPTKVVIEITAKGWTERVYAGDEVIAEQRQIMVSAVEAWEDGFLRDWSDMLPYVPQLAESMDNLSFGPFGVAVALHEIDEKWP